MSAATSGVPGPSQPSPRPSSDDPPALQSARWALEAGYWPVPITPLDDPHTAHPGKAPIGKGWGKIRHDASWWRDFYAKHPDAGIGLLLGVLGGLIDIEVDDPDRAAPVLARMFPRGIPLTLGWASNRGDHRLFAYDERLAKYDVSIIKSHIDKHGEITRFPDYLGVEIRIGAKPGAPKQIQSVIPPSLLANGQPRRWNGNAQVLPLPESVFADLDRYTLPKKSAPQTGTGTARSQAVTTGSREGSYARAALQKELDALGQAAEGVRNDQLNRSAFALGQLVGAGALDEREVKEALADVAHRIGLGDREAVATIASGLGAGKAEPRDLSGLRPTNGKATSSSAAGAGKTMAGHSAQGRPGEANRGDDGADGTDDRVPIKITADLHDVVDQSAAALVSHPDVYERGNLLVIVIRQERDDPDDAPGVKRAAGAPLIAGLNPVTARTLISRRARFWAWDKRDKDWVRKAPPKDVAEAVLGLGTFPGSRELTGVIEAPTLRPDGSLLDRPGYDRPTGLLYLPNAVYPAIPDHPTRGDMQRAASELLHLVSDFPFQADTDRAAWLALVLTLVARGAIAGPIPGFLFSANVSAAGKTILVANGARIATGRPPAFDGYAVDDAEMEKRLSAVALMGDPLLLLDNAANGSAIGCPALDRAIMADGVYRARILGKTEMTPSIPWRTVVAITGNNLSTKDDALRRFVPCFLLSPLERPETRDPAQYTITRETGLTLDEYVSRARPRLVTSALTILHGYIAAGSPKPDPALTPMDFPKWDRLVRHAAHHALGVDPCGSRQLLEANDETTLERHRVVNAWASLCRALDRPDGLTAGEAAEAVNEAFDGKRFQDFREAFPKAVLPGTTLLDPVKLGYVLRRHRDAVTPYGRLTVEGKIHNTLLWMVKNT